MSTISGVSGNTGWEMMQSMRQKMEDNLFSKLDASGKGYIDKSSLQTAISNLSASDSSSNTNVDALFTKLDTNGDGKITKQEFSDTLKQLESQFQANAGKQGGDISGMPPNDGAGMTKDQLSSLNQSGASDSKISDLVANFDKADTNQDGKVSMQEAMQYEQSHPSTSTTSSPTSSSNASSNKVDVKIMQQIMELMQAYNPDYQSNSSTLSLLA
jgi:Ca2+-binding EF-hand superfamily protein